jgi:hypothetical protein
MMKLQSDIKIILEMKFLLGFLARKEITADLVYEKGQQPTLTLPGYVFSETEYDKSWMRLMMQRFRAGFIRISLLLFP